MDHPRSISGGGEDNVAIPDDLRCKRSDGKQWRCTAMSMPDKTVCEKLYIQAKKRAANSAMRASMKKAKRKSVGESDIYLESKSDDMDLLLSSQFGDYSGSSGKKKDKLLKAQASYSPEMPAVRSLSGRSSLWSTDDLERDGSDYEDSRRSYRKPPPSNGDSDRSRSQKMFEVSPMTETSGGSSASSDDTEGQPFHQCRCVRALRRIEWFGVLNVIEEDIVRAAFRRAIRTSPYRKLRGFVLHAVVHVVAGCACEGIILLKQGFERYLQKTNCSTSTVFYLWYSRL